MLYIERIKLTKVDFLPEFKTGIFAALEKLANLPLVSAPRAQNSLHLLKGKVLQIRAEDLKQDIFLISRNKLELHAYHAAKPDVVIAANSSDLMKLVADKNAEILFSPAIKITGDIETARSFQKLFENIQLDTENMLASAIGDNATHILTGFMKKTVVWASDTKERFEDMAGDYIKEEAKISPDPSQVDKFISGVDAARSHLDRLEARISRLA